VFLDLGLESVLKNNIVLLIVVFNWVNMINFNGVKKLGQALCLLTASLCSSLMANEKPPNLIIILTDDHGYKDVGFNGCKDIPTPHIDSIAEQGVKFTDGYVSFPVCGPSRAGLMTGRYQDRFGYTTNPSVDPYNEKAGLPLEEENMAEVLTKVGYQSAIIGKWHLGSHIKHHPLNRGFDYFYGFLSGGHNYLPELLTVEDLTKVKRKWQWYSTRIMENHNRIDIDDYLTDELSDATTRFIEEKSKEKNPFFVYLAYNAPHLPLQATEKYLKRFEHIKDKKRRTYAAMVSAVDDGVGRILKTLERENELDNTIIFFLSDNGGTEKNASDNGDLRGWKSDVFEGGLRVPFAMMWKDKIKGGQTYTKPVISLDIMATIVEASNAPISKERPLDGVDLTPYMTGKKKGMPHEVLFWRKKEQNSVMAMRKGPYKLAVNFRDEKGKLLYDLKKDEGEKNNLKQAMPERVQEMSKEWKAWDAQLKDRYFPTLGKDEWWKKNP
jgi:arylsulfatase A-like enzyme